MTPTEEYEAWLAEYKEDETIERDREKVKKMRREDASINNSTIELINKYIEANGLSIPKIAKEAGMDYVRLWAILNRNNRISLDDYVKICRACKEPLEKFIPKE